MSTNTNASKVVNKDSGLVIEYIQIGEGNSVKRGDKVKIHYTGLLEDGTKFDSSRDRGEPFEAPIGIGYVIAGWDEGVVGLNIGDKVKLIIPSHLGYGDRGIDGIIPPKATLIFEVEVLDVLV
jgi:FKBP-type peptidyl-prolyl cis-trans isomerase